VYCNEWPCWVYEYALLYNNALMKSKPVLCSRPEPNQCPSQLNSLPAIPYQSFHTPFRTHSSNHASILFPYSAHYSNPIITSSLIPQSLGLGGLSSSECTLALAFLLFLSSLLEPPTLNPLLLLLFILELSEYSGGGVLEEEKEDKRVRSDVESGLS
jgi:hypothetical protein